MKRKLAVSTISFVVGGSLVGGNASVYADSSYKIDSIQVVKEEKTDTSLYVGADGFKPNFGKDKVKAKEYSKRRYNQWKKKLSSSQIKDLEGFKADPNQINNQIKQVHGDIDKIVDGKIKEKVKSLNAMIKQPENKLKQSQTIYTHFEASDLGYDNESNMMDEENPTKLNKNKINYILNHAKFSSMNEFKVSDLTLSGGKKGQRFVAELELPAGTYLGYLDNGETILPTDYAIEIKHSSIPGHPDKPKIIVENGKQVIKVKAKLLKKEAIEEKVKATEGVLNKELKKRLIRESDMVKLTAREGFESYITDSAKKAIRDVIDNVPTKIMKEIFQDENIIEFQDVKISDNNPVGLFDKYKKKIYIRANHIQLLKNVDSNSDASRALIHEIGHAVDELLLDGISETPKFKSIFEKEKNNISSIITYKDYAKKDSHEFFAEIFKAMHSTDSKQRDAVKKEAPEAVEYIKSKMKEYLDSLE